MAIAAARDGRLWIAWIDTRGGSPVVRAVRSNRKATVWGATVSGGAPKATQAGYSVDASAAPGGGVDLLANFNDGVSSTTATYHRRLLPGLTLRAAPRTRPQGREDRRAVHRPRRRATP